MFVSNSDKIRVILLLDSEKVSTWIYEIYNYILDNQNYEVVGLVLNNNPKSSPNSFFYKWLRRIDRKLFSYNPNPFSKQEIRFKESIVKINVSPIQKKFSDFFNEKDILKIKELNPDLIIRFGFRILRGDILKIAKYGLWSIHHGDNSVNRGGPPCFWEVVKKEPVTGITLQCLTENLDGGQILGKAFIKTDYTSFNRNQASAYWASVELFKAKLNELAKNKSSDLALYSETDDAFYDYPLYKDPKNLESVKIGFQLAARSINRKFNDLFFFQQWTIGYAVNEYIEKSLFRYKFLSPPKNHIWADPFLLESGNNIYMFAEQKKGSEPGEIICFEYDKKSKGFKFIDVVLKEKFHLSYPFVFEYNKQWYMIPESGNQREVILYESVNFPKVWERKKVLLNDIAAYDSTLYYHNGFWYLFAAVKLNKGMSATELLCLYYSEDFLSGSWTPHPNNPIKHDVRGARPAGKIFTKNNKIYRPAQIGSHKYGYGIQLFEIIELSPSSFIEIPVDSIEPLWRRNLLATHTFNYVEGITTIDIQQLVKKI